MWYYLVKSILGHPAYNCIFNIFFSDSKRLINNNETPDWRMIGSGLKYTLEARIRQERWRKVCVSKEQDNIDIYFTRQSANIIPGLVKEAYCGRHYLPNDTSTTDVISAELLTGFFGERYPIRLKYVINVTECSEIGYSNLHVYCDQGW